MRKPHKAAPNVFEAKRISRFALIGCVACRQLGNFGEPYDVHHLVEGYRLGHRFTIPLCPWHHRGVECTPGDKLKGPSLARSKRAFVERFGTERELLAEVDELLGYPSPFMEAA